MSWRLFAVLMLTITLNGCSTPSKQITTETVEPIIDSKSKTENRPSTETPATSVSRPKPPSLLASRHPHVVLDHRYFVVYYDKQYRLARWVKYEMSKESLSLTKAKRRERFRFDPLLKERLHLAVLPKEYRKTGYDRGHLAPSADFAFSQEANDATFVMSNMVPQKPKLNQVAWSQLEDQVRQWACGEEKVTVVTGPVLEEKMSTLPSGLPIPRAFFKIVFDETPPRKAIAFLYKQEDSTNVMNDRIIDLKQLETVVGEDFSSYLNAEERRPAQVVEWKECKI
jgi:endonuclease G